MADLIEILNLDPEAVKKLPPVYESYARYRSESREMDAYTASSFLIAGTFYSLFDPVKAHGAFNNAAYFYRRNGNPFYKIVAICGMNTDLLYSGEQKGENKAGYEFENLLAGNFIRSQAQEFDYFYDSNEKVTYQAVGRLGLPIVLYTLAYRDLAFLTIQERPYEPLLGFSNLLNRAAEQTRILQRDIYHWRNLKGNFLPVEPEILAVCVTFITAAKRVGLSSRIISERLPLDDIAILPLLVATELILYPDGQDSNREQEY